MNFSQFLQTLFGASFFQTLLGAIIGGVIVIVTNTISARRARNESIQDWHKQTYITEGVDLLITYFVDVEFHVRAGQQINLATVPTAALARIQILLDSPVLTHIASFLQHHEESIDLKDEKISHASVGIRTALISLRNELLTIIPTTANEKNYQLILPENIKQMFQKVFDDLKEVMPASLK